MLALQARGLPTKPNSSNNHMADAVVLSGYLSGSVDWWRETEGVIKKRERERVGVRERRKRKAERKPTIVCPGAPGTGRGVNSDSFQRDGQLNLRAASLQAMAILFCRRLPLWASTESSI